MVTTQNPEYFGLIPGETYAIQPADAIAHHAGVFLGWLEVNDDRTAWLAFEVSGEKIRFYNPDHIRSLLPETKPS